MATSETHTNEYNKRRRDSRRATIERHASMELVHRRIKIDPRHNSELPKAEALGFWGSTVGFVLA